MKAEDWGGMWRRQGGKQLTQHTKMQQAATEANRVKTNQQKRHDIIMTIITGRKSQHFMPLRQRYESIHTEHSWKAKTAQLLCELRLETNNLNIWIRCKSGILQILYYEKYTQYASHHVQTWQWNKLEARQGKTMTSLRKLWIAKHQNHKSCWLTMICQFHSDYLKTYQAKALKITHIRIKT